MRRLLLTALLCAGCAMLASADKTTRKGLRVRNPVSPEALCDTVAADTSAVVLSGYDKPLRSRRESIFVTNRTERQLRAVIIDITYLDRAGRQLHEATVTLPCQIPPGQTRRIDFPSWDIQQTFYYHLSGKPSRADGTPYWVSCRAESIIHPHSSVE